MTPEGAVGEGYMLTVDIIIVVCLLIQVGTHQAFRHKPLRP
jgi:hypothetical protein